MNLAEEFKAREPWVTKFAIDGVEYGGKVHEHGDGLGGIQKRTLAVSIAARGAPGV